MECLIWNQQYFQFKTLSHIDDIEHIDAYIQNKDK